MVIQIRQPQPEDGAALWQLVKDAGTLEVNSPYMYVLFAAHFSDTCLIAEEGDQALGLIIGYRPPRTPEVVFVWQVAVAATARGRGLGHRLLRRLADTTSEQGVRFLEASVTPSNAASRALFRSLARELDTECRVEPFMSNSLFPQAHEAEELFRIGPFGQDLSITEVDRQVVTARADQ